MINAINMPGGVKLKEREQKYKTSKVLPSIINATGFSVCQSCSAHNCAKCPLSIKR